MKSTINTDLFYLKYPNHPITINVIGCGGTGSLVLNNLTKIDFTLKQMNHPGLFVRAYDDDIVELFNVSKQDFSDTEMGMNKAVACIERCNINMGLLWESIPRKYSETCYTPANIDIICVDNAYFRKEYYEIEERRKSHRKKEYYDHRSRIYTIDCGNGKDFGQVVLTDFDTLPTFPERFPNFMQQDNFEHQGFNGCSMNDSLELQDLFINKFIALACAKLIWSLFRTTELKAGTMINLTKDKMLPL